MTAAERRKGALDNIAIDRPKSLAALVADRLREAIFSAELKLGQPLSEEKIAQAMNVSRTPVREALTMLQLQGLINILPQRGSVVFKPDADDIVALVQYRLTLETTAAPLAMANAPERTLADLREAIALMDRAKEAEDTLAYAQADAQFHQAFFSNCGNHYFEAAYAVAAGRISALRAHLARPLEVHRSRAYTEHIEIVEAFANGNAKRLDSILTDHILAMRENYANALGSL